MRKTITGLFAVLFTLASLGTGIASAAPQLSVGQGGGSECVTATTYNRTVEIENRGDEAGSFTLTWSTGSVTNEVTAAQFDGDVSSRFVNLRNIPRGDAIEVSFSSTSIPDDTNYAPCGDPEPAEPVEPVEPTPDPVTANRPAHVQACDGADSRGHCVSALRRSGPRS